MIDFAKEGANVVIVYYDEHQDAAETKQRIEQHGRKCLTIATDLKEEENCNLVVAKSALPHMKAGGSIINTASVTGIAPDPIWTPLIPATFTADRVSTFGIEVPMKRAGQPFELAPAYVYLASHDSVYVSGQILHVGGGEMVDS